MRLFSWVFEPFNCVGDIFEELEKVGILHKTPESAATQVNNIWNDIDSWWFSSEVQSIRKEYCRLFAYLPNDILHRIKKSLIDVVNESSKKP